MSITNKNEMSPLRKKRLLLLAKNGGSHKEYYSQYCKLIGEGLVLWTLGTAYLTEEGLEYLKDLE